MVSAPQPTRAGRYCSTFWWIDLSKLLITPLFGRPCFGSNEPPFFSELSPFADNSNRKLEIFGYFRAASARINLFKYSSLLLKCRAHTMCFYNHKLDTTFLDFVNMT